MMKKVSYLNKNMIIQISDNEYLVPSEKKKNVLYYIDTKSSLCSCSAILAGKFCKYQYAIYQFFNIKSDNFPCITPTDRYNVAKIAFGDKVLDESFYEPFISEKKEQIEYKEKICSIDSIESKNQKNSKMILFHMFQIPVKDLLKIKINLKIY